MVLVSMLFYWLVFEIIIILQVPCATPDQDSELNTIDSLTTNFITPESAFAPSESPSEGFVEASVPISIEILRIILPPGIGNAVKLVWGRKLDDLNLNITYGVHYGKDDEDLADPKIITTNESVVIENLDFCTKYNFAVTVAANDNKINPNNIRSVYTFLDRLAAPQNLQVDFEPREVPCLLVKWSASCANIGPPIGYVISIFEHDTAHSKIVTLPTSKMADFVYRFKANYGQKFDIKVSTNFPGSKATDTVTYKVPNFLQPFKVRITSSPDGAFMIYWKEPFVPLYIDRVYYEVYIYRGTNISSSYEKYYVTRPVLVYKGNESEYTFRIGLVSYDGRHRSLLTEPVAANLFGDVREINIS